jgi:translation machinery-associated protein 16
MKREREQVSDTESVQSAQTSKRAKTGEEGAAEKTATVDAPRVVHPHSRKAKQMQRKMAFDAKKTDAKRATAQRQRPTLDKCLFSYEHLVTTKGESAPWTIVPIPEIHTLIEQYIGRNDTEIDELKSKSRRGSQTGRERQLLELRERERQMYREGGFEWPNLNDGATIKALREWAGDMSVDKLSSYVQIRAYKKPVSASS